MRHAIAALTLLPFSALAQSQAALEIARAQKEHMGLVREEAGCWLLADPLTRLRGQMEDLLRHRSKHAAATGNVAIADLQRLEDACSDRVTVQAASRRARMDELASRVNAAATQLSWGTWPLPMGSAAISSYRTGAAEWELERRAEAAFKAVDARITSCPANATPPRDALTWHAYLLDHGYRCTVAEYRRQSDAINVRNGTTGTQDVFDSIERMTLPQLKALFRSEWADEIRSGKAKIAFVPQLSYENGMLSSAFPYSLFLNQTERTGYDFLVRELRRLGVRSTFIERNSLADIESQVLETEEGLARLNGEHIIISRSMGSKVMNLVKRRAEARGAAVPNVRAWLGVGGTPHGSVIADYKSRADTFYRGVWPAVYKAVNLPLRAIGRIDPRVPDHVAETAFAALERPNLATMSHELDSVEGDDPTSTLKTMTVVFLAPGFERATSEVDPVYTHMLTYGPTEGSSPLAGAAVDTRNSARLFYDMDHLAFWKLTPQQGLALYLRLLITAKRTGFAF